MNKKMFEKICELVPEVLEQEGHDTYPLDDEYLAMSACVRLAIVAARKENQDLWQRIFKFAEWCHNQQEKDIWNPAGVSFYEYIFDNDAFENLTAATIPAYVYRQIEPLIVGKYAKSKLERIRACYAT